jgi:hypothetical protein
MADREKVVVADTGGDRGSGSAALIVVAVIALLVVLFLVFGRGMLNGGGTKTIKADVDINAPAGGKSGN